MAKDAKDPDERDAEQIRRDIEETREEAGQTLDEITEQARPEHVYRRQRARLRQRAEDARQSATQRARAAVDGFPIVPVAAGFAVVGGLGSALELVRRRRRERTAAASRQRGVAALSTGGVVAAIVLLVKAVARRPRPSAAVTVGDIMTPDPEYVRDTDTLAAAARKMASLDVGALPVCGLDDRLLGVLTDRDLAIKAVAEGKDPEGVRVVELVFDDPITVAALDPVEEAVRRMSQHKVRRLPVVDGNRLVGIVTQADLAVHLRQAETGALLEDVSAAP